MHLVRVPWLAVAASLPVRLLACAILLVNNVRDVDSDTAVGKRTLAVRVGRSRTKQLYTASVVVALLAAAAMAPAAPGAPLALLAVPLAAGPLRIVATKADPPSLVKALIATGRLQLVFSVLLAVGLAL